MDSVGRVGRKSPDGGTADWRRTAVVLSQRFIDEVTAVVGADHVLRDTASLEAYSLDALKRSVDGPAELGGLPGSAAELVVLPGSTSEVAGLARLCNRERIALTPRGAGTGYSGGAVPVGGGIVLSLERLNRVLEVDRHSLLAVVQPNVITGDLQRAVEAIGLFYPPDPASLEQSVIGGNVAECAGGPRAFKYGTTKRYVLGLEAVLPSGDVIRTGGRSVKNVVGYDLTQLLVGSEGTLAIVTEVILRLIPRPPARATLRAPFPTVSDAVAAVGAMLAGGVTPAAMELIDGECLAALEGQRATSPRQEPAGALLLVEVDGLPTATDEELVRVSRACEAHGALDVQQATTETDRDRLWDERRGLSLALRALAPLKLNHDVVVPRGRIRDLFELIDELRASADLPMPSFGHVGDGNIHVNILVDPADRDAMRRARRAERKLLEGVVGLGGSISGEHGIGFAKAPFLELELTPETIALMRRLKQVFDPNGILNPGKIFPESAPGPGRQ